MIVYIVLFNLFWGLGYYPLIGYRCKDPHTYYIGLFLGFTIVSALTLLWWRFLR